MVYQLSTAVRDAKANAFETTVGTSPTLEIRTGAQPANCAAADSGTLLATIALPSDWLAAASAGVKALAGLWTGTAAATGTAQHFRLKASGGTVHAQGSVTATGGGGDVTLTSVAVSFVGQQVTVTSFTHTVGGA